MHLTLYLALSALSGMVIAVMVVANTLLGQATTMGVSLIINHTIGLVLLSAILLVGRKRPAIRGPQTSLWYLYFNGLFGVAILNIQLRDDHLHRRLARDGGGGLRPSGELAHLRPHRVDGDQEADAQPDQGGEPGRLCTRNRHHGAIG